MAEEDREEYIKVPKSYLDQQNEIINRLVEINKEERKCHDEQIEKLTKQNKHILNGIIGIVVLYLIGYWILTIFFH